MGAVPPRAQQLSAARHNGLHRNAIFFSGGHSHISHGWCLFSSGHSTSRFVGRAGWPLMFSPSSPSDTDGSARFRYQDGPRGESARCSAGHCARAPCSAQRSRQSSGRALGNGDGEDTRSCPSLYMPQLETPPGARRIKLRPELTRDCVKWRDLLGSRYNAAGR